MAEMVSCAIASTTELLARHLAGLPVVSAFKAILAEDLEKDGRPAGSTAP